MVAYREQVAHDKRRAFRDWEYWGKPVPGFGCVTAHLLVIGLAPAAHGGNRTGRMFTGDRSGDWLYRTLHRFGFAAQATSTSRADGQQLRDAYVAAAVRCAPPDNKPSPAEFAACRSFLVQELELLRRARVVVALGCAARDAYLLARLATGRRGSEPRPRFAHGHVSDLGDVTLIASYHPSQRNTQTGLLTESMFDAVFARARAILESAAPPPLDSPGTER